MSLVTQGRCLLKQLLKKKGLTQRELASRLNVNESQVSEWVNDIKVMTLLTAVNVARVLNCTVEELYEWHE